MPLHESIGVRRVVNARAAGVTGLGGSIMRPEVVEAMTKASKSYLYMREIRAQVGKTIARVTGAEAGCVCNGSAAGIIAMTAACVCGPNVVKLGQLPKTDGLKNEVIVLWGQVTEFLRGSGNCIEITGAKMRVIGSTTGASVAMGNYSAELEDAIDDKTAAVCYTISQECMQRFWQLNLEDVVEIAHSHGVPVIVDAAAYTDLRYPTSVGADLTTFSGGKCVGGPSSSGIICGNKTLIEACELTEWTICRSMKIGKEEMAGLNVALEQYESRDWSQWASTTATRAEASQWAEYIYHKLSTPPIPYTKISKVITTASGMWIADHEKKYPAPPQVRLELDESGLEMTAHEVYEALAAGNPSVLVSNHNEKMGFLDIVTSPLIAGEERIVAQRVRDVLTVKQRTRELVPYP